MKKIIGWSLIAFVFLLFFAGHVITHGFVAALLTWLLAIGLCALIVVGAWLIYD
jgi:uncharacterized membrane protein